MFGVARNCLLHHFRSRFRDRLDFDPSRGSVADLDPRPSTVAAQNERQRQLLDAMRTLALDLQIALELYYWEELTATELAAALQIPVGTAKSRLRRGRQALAKALHESNHEAVAQRVVGARAAVTE